MANDDFERQARNTTSSLDDLESKYNVAIERGVMLEEEMKVGEQEREALRIETQRLRDELGDLKVEAEIRSDKLRHAQASALRQTRQKPTPPYTGTIRPQSSLSENSGTTATSSPTIATPPTKSTSSTISETPTPPSPPISEPLALLSNESSAIPLAKSRLSFSNSGTTPRPSDKSRGMSRHSRGPSISANNGRPTSFAHKRVTVNRPGDLQNVPGPPTSGSLHQIRGLIGKMQKLEQRVNSARSKLPAPALTPDRVSSRSNSALGQSYIPSTVTVRSNRKRTNGSDAEAIVASAPSQRPSDRYSLGIPQPSPGYDAHSSSRPSSRASISSRLSSGLVSTAHPSDNGRPSSRQSSSRIQDALSHNASNLLSESRRPRSSIGGSYSMTHHGRGHGHSTSVNRLTCFSPRFYEREGEESEVQTPTPAKRSSLRAGDMNSGIPSLSMSTKKIPGESSNGRKIGCISGSRGREEGDMGPPERRRLSGVGETF